MKKSFSDRYVKRCCFDTVARKYLDANAAAWTFLIASGLELAVIVVLGLKIWGVV